MVQQKPKNKDKIFPSPTTPNLDKRVCGCRGHETIVAKIYILQEGLCFSLFFSVPLCHKAITTIVRFYRISRR